MEAARPATEADLGQLVDLATAAVAELGPGRGGPMWSRREARAEPVGSSLADAIASTDAGGDHLAVVGTIDEVVVGYAVVRAEPLRDGGMLGVIEDLYTEPGARKVGVGEAMMGEVVAWCEARGCVGVDAMALPGQRDTKNFFESFGLVARAIVVHRSLANREGKAT